jgi:hypothetical protein
MDLKEDAPPLEAGGTPANAIWGRKYDKENVARE